MARLFDESFLSELPALRFSGNANQTAVMAGARKSNAKGSSVEFSDFREYLPGDDIRRLDWNAYARLGKLYMKLYREERESILSVYVDLSPSMNYGGEFENSQAASLKKDTPTRAPLTKAPLAKASQALRVAAVLSWVALKGQDRVRIILCGLPEGESASRESSGFGKAVPPQIQTFHGSTAFTRVLAYLQEVEDYREYLAERQKNTMNGKYRQGSQESGKLWESIRRNPPTLGGITALISDFLPEEAAEEAKFLAGFRRQNLLLLQVLAEEELEPDFAGTNRLIDMEDGADLRVTLTPGLLRSYQKELAALQGRLAETARRYQGFYRCIRTGEPASAFLREVSRWA